MDDSSITQPEYQKETLRAIFLRNRTLTTDIWPEVFGKLKQQSLISLSGSGKTVFISELIARALMLGIEVLLLDVDQHFRMFKLIDVLLKYTSEDQIQFRLERLKILTCNETNFNSIIEKLPQILEIEKQISLVVIDSIGLFYYAQIHLVPNGKTTSKATFIKSYLQKLSILSSRINVTVIYSHNPVYTTPGCMNGISVLSELTTHSIELQKNQNESFSMVITSKAHDKTHSFKIDQGIQLSPSH